MHFHHPAFPHALPCFMTLLIFHLINSYSSFKTNSCPSKCGPWTTSISSIWELVRNTNSQRPTVDPTESDTLEDDDQICTLTSSSGDSYQFYNLRRTVLRHNSFINVHSTLHIPIVLATLFHNHIYPSTYLFPLPHIESSNSNTIFLFIS